MDRALDALLLLPTEAPTTRAARYELSLVTDPTPVTIDPAAPASSALVTFGASARDASQAALASLPDVDARLQALASLFTTALPARAAVAPFFAASGFQHNGLGLDAYLDQVLLQPRATPDGFDYLGYTLSRVALVRVVDDEQLWISVRVSAGGGVPWEEVLLVKKSAGVWQIAGNQELAAAGVNSLVRITAKPLTEAEVAALPGIEVWAELEVNGVVRTHCYMLPLESAPTSYFLLGCAGDTTFPTFLIEGNPYAQRATAQAHSHFFAHASAAIEQFVVFYVSSEQVDARVASVKVKGPGIPAAGLTLVRPNPSFPRDQFIFQGDSWNWDAFNTARCPNMDPVADCGLDWSKISSGASYTYEFLDGEGSTLGTAVRRLMGTPRTEDEWLAQRDQMFPQFTLADADQITIAHLYYVSAGAPYAYGGTKTVTWKEPTDPTLEMEYVSLWRQYFLGDTGLEADRREESCSYSLYEETSPLSRSCTWQVDQLATWAWCDLGAKDLYGNQFSQEVSPGNPY
jgi:hypothetical protein